MGYFDGLTDACFKNSNDGRQVFYPYGVLGNGYYMPDSETYQKTRGFVKNFYIITFPLVIILGATRLILPAIVISSVLMLYYFFKIKKIATNLEKCDIKLTMKESYINSARSHNIVTLWLLLIFSIFFVISGSLMVMLDTKAFWPGLLGIIFFGPCAIVFIFMIKNKK